VAAADAEMIELVEMEIRELLTEMGYDGENATVIKGSALCALEGKNDDIGVNTIAELLKAVDEKIPTPVRDLDKPFMMPIENVYSIGGRGTVVTGRLERGILKKGNECEIIGYNKTVKTTVTGVEMFHKILEESQAGDQLGALIRGTKRDDVRRGMFLVKPGTMKMRDHLKAQVYILTKDEGGRGRPFTSLFQLQLFSKTWDCAAQVYIDGKEMVMPGEDTQLSLKLFKPMAVEKGQKFTLRDGVVTVGFGVVADYLPNLSEDDRALLMEGKKGIEKRAKKAAAASKA